MSGKVSLSELEHLSIVDVDMACSVLDAHEEAEFKAYQKAKNKK